jgi:hypothetical protein
VLSTYCTADCCEMMRQALYLVMLSAINAVQ